MLANGGWDLIRRLKGSLLRIHKKYITEIPLNVILSLSLLPPRCRLQNNIKIKLKHWVGKTWAEEV